MAVFINRANVEGTDVRPKGKTSHS